MNQGQAQRALDGLVVADFSRILAGPYASMMLGDFGAQVIKIESETGDETRGWLSEKETSGHSSYFASVNRNKRTLTCQLDTQDGLARATEIAARADIVIENFRPGVMARFGLDYDTLRSVNPRLIYCSITGFGSGAGATLPGFDLLVQGLGGLMSITGDPDGEPRKVGVALIDVLAGLNAFSGILLAIGTREKTGVGQKIDINLLSSLLSALTNQAASTVATGESPPRLGNAHPSISPYSTFTARDRSLIIAVGNDKQFTNLCIAIGTEHLATDPRFVSNASRVVHREQLTLALNTVLKTRIASEWVSLLTSAHVPAGIVNSVAEAITLAEHLGLSPIAEGDRTYGISNPITLSDTPAQYLLPPPFARE